LLHLLPQSALAAHARPRNSFTSRTITAINAIPSHPASKVSPLTSRDVLVSVPSEPPLLDPPPPSVPKTWLSQTRRAPLTKPRSPNPAVPERARSNRPQSKRILITSVDKSPFHKKKTDNSKTKTSPRRLENKPEKSSREKTSWITSVPPPASHAPMLQRVTLTTVETHVDVVAHQSLYATEKLIIYQAIIDINLNFDSLLMQLYSI
jgi:hypothetical protein